MNDKSLYTLSFGFVLSIVGVFIQDFSMSEPIASLLGRYIVFALACYLAPLLLGVIIRRKGAFNNNLFQISSWILQGIIIISLIGGMRMGSDSEGMDYKQFRKSFSETLESNYNIISIPEEFYKCAYDQKNSSSTNDFDTGLEMAGKCLFQYIDKIDFSDNGVLILKKHKVVFISQCIRNISEYKDQVNAKDYCDCIHSGYINNKVGFKDILQSDWEVSEFNQKILNNCIALNSKN